MIANDASRLINDIMSVPDKSIPIELLGKATAIAIFPGASKAAFIGGGAGHQGVIIKRFERGWGAPLFFNLRQAGFAAQLDTQGTDYVLLIMDQNTVTELLKDKYEIGTGVRVAAGPVGREAGASGGPSLDFGILSYSRTSGVFSGSALKRAVITPDNYLNEAIYQVPISEQHFYSGRNGKIPAEVRIVTQTLARYSRR